MNSIGNIFGDTGTRTFKFSPYQDSSVRIGDYVQTQHEIDGWVLAQISDIHFSTRDDRIIAVANVIGSRDDSGHLILPRYPFKQSATVHCADAKLIEDSLGLSDGNVYIGKLEGQDLQIKLNANKLIQKHCSILAKTGSGKSYTAGVILEELLDNNVPILIIDPHGEYKTLRDDGNGTAEDYARFGICAGGYKDRVTVYSPNDTDKPFRLNGLALSVKELIDMSSDLRGATQLNILYDAVQSAKSVNDSYTIDEIIFHTANHPSKARLSVIYALEALKDTGLLEGNPTSINELMQKGKAAIIDMKGVNPETQQMIVTQICTRLFEGRKIDKVNAGILVVEEAHNYCPEKGFGKSQCSTILRTIASEGRKFGLGMMVISQRPARVDKNVLSQCNTQIIMKVTNPNDLKAIVNGLEGIGKDMEDEIKRLSAGVAMIVSNDIERPIFVDVRVRKSKHGGESIDIVG